MFIMLTMCIVHSKGKKDTWKVLLIGSCGQAVQEDPGWYKHLNPNKYQPSLSGSTNLMFIASIMQRAL